MLEAPKYKRKSIVVVPPNLHEAKADIAEVSSCPSVLLKGLIECSLTSNDLLSPILWVRVLEPVIGCIREL